MMQHHQRPSRSFSLAPSIRRKSLALLHPFESDDGRPAGLRFRQQHSRLDHEEPPTEELEEENSDGDAELPFPGYVRKAFFLFEQTTPPRRWCLVALTWPWFERISMGIILLNCITLGMYQPCSGETCSTTRCRVLEGFDHLIFAFFAIEMCTKIMAMGLVGKKTYLSETWNRLDMFIVFAGAVEYAVNTQNLNLSAIRTIRVLRPLRAINRIPSLRILVMLLLDTLPMLGNVLMLCFFVFFIFGIVGVQLWAGLLRHRCRLELPPNISVIGVNLTDYYIGENDKDFICSQANDSGMTKCADLPQFLYNGRRCNASALVNGNNSPTNGSCVNWNQYYTLCRPVGSNPFQGAISFDNIGLAWVAIFQVISLAGWVNIMYYVQDAHNFWSWIYFAALIVIGAFFMINLCLVVIATQFSETKKRETERMLQERKRFHSSSTLTSSAEPGGCYDEIIKYIAHLMHRARRKFSRFLKRRRAARAEGANGGTSTADPNFAMTLHRKKRRRTLHVERKPEGHPLPSLEPNPAVPGELQSQSTGQANSPRAPRASPEMSDVDPMSSPRRPNCLVMPGGEFQPSRESSVDVSNGALMVAGSSAPDRCQTQYPVDAARKRREGNRVHMLQTRGSSHNSYEEKQSTFPSDSSNPGAAATETNVGLKFEEDGDDDDDDDEEEDDDADADGDDSDSDSSDSSCEDEPQKKRGNSYWKLFRRQITRVVDHRYFQRGILLAILVNTLSMGIEYHNQPETLTLVLEYSNIFFSALFAVEMMLKVLSEGPFKYIRNGFNVFDGFIVILSLVELLQGGTGGLSVLRTFRLLRILKLVRFLPALRYQLVIMLKTMDNVATFFALLVLFIFIFSILGMNLFGGKLCVHIRERRQCSCREVADGLCKCDRKNFDSLLWAIVTVFQILTQEDWNEVLYNGMAKTSSWAALYFIFLMTFGNYVLFNLLVAILVEGFSAEGDELEMEQEMAAKELEASVLQVRKIKDINKLENQNKELKLYPSAICHALQMKEENKDDIKNNKEKEKLMFQGLPPLLAVTKDDNVIVPFDGSGTLLNPPPIITRTAATPMATPQSSPGEVITSSKELKKNLMMDAADAWNASRLQCPEVRHGSNLRLNRSRSRDENGKNTVDEDDTDNSNNDSQESVQLSPTQNAKNNANDQKFFEPLNNQRSTFNQSSSAMLGKVGRRSSVLGTNRITLSRQNSICSHCAGTPLSRQGSVKSQMLSGSSRTRSAHVATPRDEYMHNNLSAASDDKESNMEAGDEQGRDQDARIDGWWTYSWCPKPEGCFRTRSEYSLYIFHPTNRIRCFCQSIIAWCWFDYMVLILIALNCITLAMERPDIPSDSVERHFLTISNYAFTVLFAVEMTLKVIAKGLVLGRHTYLKSGWNVMDGGLVIISLIDIVVSLTASHSPKIFGILRVFRLLRTLRPLRVISRAPGLKLVVQTLLSSLRPIGNIVLICCTFFIIFGILGVQLFKGTFYYCEGTDVSDITNKTDCHNKGPPYRWVNRKYNFDNLGQALMALFVLASKDGWVNIMYTGLDAVGVDQQPKVNHNEWRLVYFISFLLLVAFFVLNMFVGVVVENFHKCRESQEQEEKARRAANRAKKMERKRRRLRELPYWSHYSKPRLLLHTVICSKYFDLSIAGVIGLNVITMALEFHMMPPELLFALKIFNFFFTSVFILEAIVKIISLGLLRYLRDRWNQLDIAIVFLSIAGIILEEMKSGVIPINPTIIRVMRVLRIARVLKLLKMAKSVRALLDTVVQALPEVGNLGLLFFLLFFIFAALGVELFGRVECSESHPCEGLSKHAHFRNFGMAFLTLFRVATGDNWNGIMKDTLREDCDVSDDCVRNCCVSTIIAPVFFVIFVLMAQFVLVNVVVAVLMKHLEESHKHMDDELDLETEIQRELEEEERLRSNQKYQQYMQENVTLISGTFDTNKRPLMPGLTECEFENGDRFNLDVKTLLQAQLLNGMPSRKKRLSLPANFTYSKTSSSDNVIFNVCSDEPLLYKVDEVVIKAEERQSSESCDQQTEPVDVQCFLLGRGTSSPVLCSETRTLCTPFARTFHLSVPRLPNASMQESVVRKPGPPWPCPSLVTQMPPTVPDCDKTAATPLSFPTTRTRFQSQPCVSSTASLSRRIRHTTHHHHSCTDSGNCVFCLQDGEGGVQQRPDSAMLVVESPICDRHVCGKTDYLSVGQCRDFDYGSVYQNCRFRTLLRNGRQQIFSSFPDVTRKCDNSRPASGRYSDDGQLPDDCTDALDRYTGRELVSVGSQICSLDQLPAQNDGRLRQLLEELEADANDKADVHEGLLEESGMHVSGDDADLRNRHAEAVLCEVAGDGDENNTTGTSRRLCEDFVDTSTLHVDVDSGDKTWKDGENAQTATVQQDLSDSSSSTGDNKTTDNKGAVAKAASDDAVAVATIDVK